MGWLGRILKIRAQPADRALCFLHRALLVQDDEVAEDVIGVSVRGKAVGLQHLGIEFVVQFFEHTDETLRVDGSLFGGQGALFSERFDDVLQAGEGEVLVRCLACLFAGLCACRKWDSR